MLYAGALAAGAFVGQDVVVFGREVPTGWKSFAVMVAAGTIGYTLGSLAGWAIGDYGGLVERHGKWFHLSPERFERAERWFDRWGGEAVFLGRITPIVRSFVSIGRRISASSRPLHAADLHRLDHVASRSPASAGRWARTGRASITPSGTSSTRWRA